MSIYTYIYIHTYCICTYINDIIYTYNISVHIAVAITASPHPIPGVPRGPTSWRAELLQRITLPEEIKYMLKPTSPAEENPFEKIMGFSMRFSWEKMLEMMIFQEVDPQNRRDLSGVHGNIMGNHSFFNSDLVVS